MGIDKKVTRGTVKSAGRGMQQITHAFDDSWIQIAEYCTGVASASIAVWHGARISDGVNRRDRRRLF